MEGGGLDERGRSGNRDRPVDIQVVKANRQSGVQGNSPD